MQDEGIVVVGRYAWEHEAQVAQAVLQTNGIDAILIRDDVGGMLPSLDFLREVKLAVRAEDAEEARSLLEPDDAPPGGTEAD